MTTRRLLALGPHGFHRLAYDEWGDPGNRRVLVCVHGLSRNRHDFAVLAAALADEWRVICPDMPGRGDSDWLAVKADYDLPVYVQDMAQLLARSGADRVAWLGTSMGGLIGMALAAQPDSPIAALVLNDIGAVLPGEGLARIQGTVAGDPRFIDLAAAEAWYRETLAPFGPMTDADWRRLTATSVRPADGGLRQHHDPGIAENVLKSPAKDIELWRIWDPIRCPVLVMRGERTDFLRAETAAAMAGRGPGCTLREWPGIGHAPALMDGEQIGVVRGWLGQAWG